MLNIGLLFVFLVSLIVIFFTQKSLPNRKTIDFRGRTAAVTLPQEIPVIDLKKIYENDVFQTYQEEPIPVEPGPPAISLDPPTPPGPKQSPSVFPSKLQFIEPLKVELTGIIYDSDNLNSNRVILDNRLYAVGDMISDAEIIKIYKNKIILLRSNGQLETIFLRSSEMTLDRAMESKTSWDDVVYKIDENNFVIDPVTIKDYFINGAQFIESLNLTTVAIQGVAVGSRIGVMSQDSIGSAIGLHYGDVILNINNMAVKTTKDRKNVYNVIRDLISKDEGAKVQIRLIRNQMPVEINFILEPIEDFLKR